MSSFSLHAGATCEARWDLDGSAPPAIQNWTDHAGRLIVEEERRVHFALSAANYDYDYRVLVGDTPVTAGDEGDGAPHPMRFGSELRWQEAVYFESARGETTLRLQQRPTGGPTQDWESIFEKGLYIVPSKLGEASYEQMSEDLERVGRSLLLDLFGKSVRSFDVGLTNLTALHSKEEELEYLTYITQRLARLVRAISSRPAGRVVRRQVLGRYWGTQSLPTRAQAALSRRGVNLAVSERPVVIPTLRLEESFDITEHRILRAVLRQLANRASACAMAAEEHIASIERDKPFRDVRFGNGPSLYELRDRPRIQKLRQGYATAMDLSEELHSLYDLPFWQTVPPKLSQWHASHFQQGPAYQQIPRLLSSAQGTQATWSDSGRTKTTAKLTSRLFEQWCFLQVVDAFRSVGVSFQQWSELMRRHARDRFLLDFDRGTRFDGQLGSDIRIAIRFEPWILGVDAAKRTEETLCRHAESVPWSPDIVVEFLKEKNGDWLPVYVVVLDCKYSRNLHQDKKGETSKYFQIRSTKTKRQVVRQLWLMHPSAVANIESWDPAVTFGLEGVSCPTDEQASFTMAVNPIEEDIAEPPPSPRPVLKMFAAGTLAYVQRHFVDADTAI